MTNVSGPRSATSVADDLYALANEVVLRITTAERPPVA